MYCPVPCGSIGWALSHAQEGLGFNSQLGHRPCVSLDWCVCSCARVGRGDFGGERDAEAAYGYSALMSMILSLSLPLSQINNNKT